MNPGDANGSALAALKAAAEVFEAMDAETWPQTEADIFFGNEGKCPVYYDDAQNLVLAAIAQLEPKKP